MQYNTNTWISLIKDKRLESSVTLDSYILLGRENKNIGNTSTSNEFTEYITSIEDLINAIQAW